MSHATCKTCCRGLTLVELMIGLVLSLLVMGAAVSVFVGSKETFRLEEDISTLQESYRFIVDRFGKDFSMAGYSGCSMSFDGAHPIVKSNISGAGASDVIQGVEDSMGGPDSITISYARTETGMAVVEGSADPASPLYVSRDLPLYQAVAEKFSKGVPVILLVGNCLHADIFLATGVADVISPSGAAVGSIEHAAEQPIGGVKNVDGNLSEPYGRLGEQTATVYQLTSVTYAINRDPESGMTGLYETRNGGARQLLLDNVTDMQILYGIDSVSAYDGNADKYLEWSDTLRVSDITSLKVTLRMVVGRQTTNANPIRDYSFTFKLRDMGLNHGA